MPHRVSAQTHLEEFRHYYQVLHVQGSAVARYRAQHPERGGAGLMTRLAVCTTAVVQQHE